MRKLAIIDLGTNTFHLLIVRVNEGRMEVLHQEKAAVKIGEGGISQRLIIAEAESRAINALTHFKSVIAQHQVQEVHAVATSAIRNADNSAAITQKIFEQTGFRIKVISGEEEAELIYQGVRKAMQLPEKNYSLIMDIGGGSVEFIIANQNTSVYKQSFEIGAQRLLDRFHHHDPILPKEVDRLYQYLTEKLKPLSQAVTRFKPNILVGSSGSFETLSDMYCINEDIERQPDATEYPLSLESFYQSYDALLIRSRRERLAIPGMIPLRVDMIVVACCLIRFALEAYKLSDLRVSGYALKEGLLHQVLETQPHTS